MAVNFISDMHHTKSKIVSRPTAISKQFNLLHCMCYAVEVTIVQGV